MLVMMLATGKFPVASLSSIEVSPDVVAPLAEKFKELLQGHIALRSKTLVMQYHFHTQDLFTGLQVDISDALQTP